MSVMTKKELSALKREENRKRRELIRSLTKEAKDIQKSIGRSDKLVRKERGIQVQYEALVENSPLLSSPIQELQDKRDKFEEVITKNHEAENKTWQEIYKIKQEIRQLNNRIKQINSDNKRLFKKTLEDLQKRMKKNGLESLDAIPQFENNEEWSESDVVQQEFDKKASQEDELVHNGLSKIGSGGRSVLMTIDKLENELDEIDLSKVFKDRLGLDELENYNDFISEIRDTSDVRGEKVALVRKQYFPATTKFDIVRSELRPSNTGSLIAIRNKYANVINELASVFKIRMKNVKHIKFRGNQEEGVIDARSVYKIPNNLDDHIFEKAFAKPNDRVIVSVALDISGSMDKDYAGSDKLQEIAVILDAALTRAMIKHEVVGYGAPADRNVAALNANEVLYTRTQHRLETITYRSLEGANGLGNIEVKCWDNADGESLRGIARRLMKSRSKMKVIINVGDGKSFLHGANVGVLDNDLVQTMRWLEANRIKLYPIGFNDYPKNIYGSRYLKIDDYGQLAKFFMGAE